MAAGFANRRVIAKAVALLCFPLAGTMLLWSPGYTQDLHPDIPTHTHYSATEQGWACNDGFRQVAGFCIRDEPDVPSQTAVEVFDGQWRCLAGYRRANGSCVLPTAPAHASLLADGGWECDWGFRKAGSRCEEVSPPEHAYLEASGRDWVCFPGFERISNHCVPAPGTAPPPAVSPAGGAEPKPST